MKSNSLEDLSNFCAIVDAGSLQSAALQLNIPAPTLSRRLKNLEHTLGVKLLLRSAHRLQLTTEGDAYYSQLSPHFSRLSQDLNILSRIEDAPSGDIILSVPEGMLNICVNDWIIEFLQNWPKINIFLESANKPQEFEANKIDVAVRLRPEGPSNWIVKKVLSNEKWLVASTDYMQDRSLPNHPEQLGKYDIITNYDNQSWQFMVAGKLQSYRFKPRYRPNNLFHALEASRRGLGISYYPRFLVEPFIKAGSLIRLLPEFTAEESSIYLLYAAPALQSARVRLFIDFLKQRASIPEDIFKPLG
ncbi:MAG: LysR family transcriptional regulator [Rhodobacteraceae bacterium]|nr:LysR family transcriptional regulator [Paracoccaceae bacterium]